MELPSTILDSGDPRFELRRAEGGAVLLDAATGAILFLNKTATTIWEQFLAGTGYPRLVEGWSNQFGIAMEVARADVASALTLPEPESPRPDAHFRFEIAPGGRCLALAGDIPVLELGPAGDSVTILEALSADVLASYLSGIVPKLLALGGELVLHASAVHRGGQAVAFLGKSGAGKTTTAHAFEGNGATVFSEDMLLVRMNSEGALAVTDAEAMGKRWASQMAAQHAGRKDQLAGFSLWPAGATNPASRLSSIYFLHPQGRRGSEINRNPLVAAETATRLYANSFVSSISASACRGQMVRVIGLSRTVKGYSTIVPEGLPSLMKAARSYTEIWTS